MNLSVALGLIWKVAAKMDKIFLSIPTPLLSSRALENILYFTYSLDFYGLYVIKKYFHVIFCIFVHFVAGVCHR